MKFEDVDLDVDVAEDEQEFEFKFFEKLIIELDQHELTKIYFKKYKFQNNKGKVIGLGTWLDNTLGSKFLYDYCKFIHYLTYILPIASGSKGSNLIKHIRKAETESLFLDCIEKDLILLFSKKNNNFKSFRNEAIPHIKNHIRLILLSAYRNKYILNIRKNSTKGSHKKNYSSLIYELMVYKYYKMTDDLVNSLSSEKRQRINNFNQNDFKKFINMKSKIFMAIKDAMLETSKSMLAEDLLNAEKNLDFKSTDLDFILYKQRLEKSHKYFHVFWYENIGDNDYELSTEFSKIYNKIQNKINLKGKKREFPMELINILK